MGDKKMKRLTLDQTWEQCLAMWKYVSRQCKGKKRDWCVGNVNSLKVLWLSKNGIEEDEITQDCFFCDRTSPNGSIDYWCSKCSGRKLDPSFYCMDKDYHFERSPRAFYAKLKELNKIRLAKK
jgi:hypothetical protein